MADGTEESKSNALAGILRAVSSLTVGGLKPPRLAGSLTQDNVMQFLRQFAEYNEKIEVACEDGVPRRPCGVTELISSSNMHAITTLSGNSGTLTEEQCIAALKKIGGIELRT